MASRKRLASPSVEVPAAKKTLKPNVATEKEKSEKCRQITQRNQQESPLLRLPAEIRNSIYIYALGGFEFHFRGDCSCMGEGLIQRSWTKQRYPISLLFVCRQLHAETALLPYSLNEFYFISYERTASCFIKARKPAQIRALQKMRVGLYSEGDEEYDVPPGLYWNEQPGVHWAELFEIDF